MPAATFRFYAELERFLAPWHRQREFIHSLSRDATVKHMVEALGVPHTEVELILVNGAEVGFSCRLRAGDRIGVYPHFSLLDMASRHMLRPPPREAGRFIADAHLGQLARKLRMLGFDVLYRNDFSDREIASLAVSEERIVLTRDRDLLIRKEIVHGCYLHSKTCAEQVREVLVRFRLAGKARIFSRCLNCNGVLCMVAKSMVTARVPMHSWLAHERFFECEACAQVYWEGSHVTRMRERIADLQLLPQDFD